MKLKILLYLMYSNEFKIMLTLFVLLLIYVIYKNKSLEKMTDDSTFSPVHLTAIKNLGSVAASMISADGGTLTLPYNVKVNGKLDINSSLTTNNESIRLTVWNGKAYLQTNQDTWTFANTYSSGGTKNLENVNNLTASGNLSTSGNADVGGTLTTNNGEIRITTSGDTAFLQTSKSEWRFADISSWSGNKNLVNAKINGKDILYKEKYYKMNLSHGDVANNNDDMKFS